MTDRADVPPGVLAAIRTVCLGLPEAYEESAWVGTRWRIRTRTFAHVLQVDEGRPPAYARTVGTDGPVTVLTFRSSGPELATLAAVGSPFFAPPWRGDEVAMVLEEGFDRDEVAELVTESYCLLAPRRLVGLVPRPSAGGDRSGER